MVCTRTTVGAPPAPWYLISVDPGRMSAWALWRRRGDEWSLVAYGRIDNADFMRLVEFMKSITSCLFACHVIVEGQWFSCPMCAKKAGRVPKGASWDDVQRLIESRLAWQHAALLHQATISTVSTSWIRVMTKGIPGASKERMKTVCEARFPEVELVDDERDALLIGAYWIEESGWRVT